MSERIAHMLNNACYTQFYWPDRSAFNAFQMFYAQFAPTENLYI